MNEKNQIVVVDDDSLQLKWLSKMLKVGGHTVREFESGKEALESLTKDTPQILICDIVLRDIDGISILSEVRKKFPQLKVIMITGAPEFELAVKSLRLGAFDYITKPIDPELMFETIDRAVRTYELEEENAKQLEELEKRDERLRQELQLAKVIISDILPSKYPRTNKLKFGTVYMPAGEIGGDYYDFIQFREPNRVGIVVGDITGKGVPAALLMTMFKLRANEIFRSVFHPAECMSVLNKTLSKDFPQDNFVSAFYTVIDSDKGELIYSKASNDPGVILRQGKTPILLDRGSGYALAAFDPETFGESAYTQHSVKLEHGDILVLFTDGLIEIFDKNNRQLKLDGLLEWLKEDEHLQPQLLAEQIVKRAQEFAGTEKLQDDVTLVAVRYDG
ncbi:MAG: hypothetical protein COS94_06100 [Candidatus Hydrogenedentes bacterium CG07_land_8_20_14_0_80_42_17]|nr:MAG: hypothetical protein COS94_06100 [Candidatus Hydrogenedentes bacterium CG07_land_8_20_14_0_80_42_17]